jgi:hypothetical protein
MQNLGMYSGLFEQLAFAYAGKHGFCARPARRPDRDVPHRSAECASSFSVNVTGEHDGAVFRPHVHAYGVGLICDINVMWMRQRRTLPNSKFFFIGWCPKGFYC